MDREDLDKQLKENGEAMKDTSRGSRSGRMKIAALALAMLVIGGAGGCYFGGFSGTQKSPAASSYQMPQGSNKKMEDLPAIRNTAVVQAVKEVGPAIVGITTRVYDRDMFNRRVEVGQSVGSGVLFDKKGYIVTNNHVVSGSKEVNVSLSSGKTVPGKVVGTDPSTDLAVVKIEGSDDLPVATFGDSDALQVGETAIAIGNPLGLEFQGTVTVGVISALNRSLDDIDQRFKLIQTDAAINPGNSGGALVTADGKVVGINSAKIAKEGVEGMGFAIPINSAKGIIQQLISNGKVTRAYLGVYAADKDIAQRYGYNWDHDGGVLVMKIASRSPMSLTDIRPGDYILAIDGQTFDTVKGMREILDNHKPGDRIKVTYEHNGKKEDTEVLLAAAPESGN
ncbi:trypsin-like peptidase domain-containing protein [uncultured Dialister sp.]|uniref:S1C family serine protease n=2 Tax=uncultured Dialister sp. TaxID=278064 RepID=UPI00261C575A|nr:trypsin-like peptidase domain-containing protein [uncultured Dialister sp.]